MPTTNPIQLNDAGASLKITEGTQTRNIFKSQIKEISVIKTNILKIDIGAGALRNIFIPYADVVFPILGNAEQLRDFINNTWMITGAGVGASGVANDQLTKLNEISVISDKIRVDLELLTDPLMVDDNNPYVIYKGYANVASLGSSPVWAIKRITQNATQTITEWADGNKNFDNIWDNRLILVYS